jgi:hypothetical protein
MIGKELLGEVLPDLLSDLSGDHRNRVISVDDHSQEIDGRIESLPHLGHRGHKVVGPLHGVETGTHRDHHMVSGPQGIDGEYPQRWWSIEKDEVVDAKLLVSRRSRSRS